MKDQLVFDTSDVNTILDSDNVGAYVRASDGTLITATGTALDVNIDNASIVVTATDLDIRDLTQTDEITAFQGGTWDIGTLTGITNDVNIADGGNSITVDAVDLDIRDLTAASDSVASWTHDGTGNAITSTGGGLDVNVLGGVNVEVDLSHVDDSVRLGDGTSFFTSTTVGADIGLDVNLINASLVVTATDLDIRDLVAATDSVSSWLNDGAGNAIGSTAGSLDVNVTNTISVDDAALADTAILSSVNTLGVASTAEAVVASALANRKYLMVYNNGNRKVFVGSAAVTEANGFPVSPGSILELRAGASVAVNYIGSTVGQEIRALELS